jgi:hypothetical protein
MLFINPMPIGSVVFHITIGIGAVARFRAEVAGPPLAINKSGVKAYELLHESGKPLVVRLSKATVEDDRLAFEPSTLTQSVPEICPESALRFSSARFKRSDLPHFPACWASAASGAASTAPRPATKARRFIG